MKSYIPSLFTWLLLLSIALACSWNVNQPQAVGGSPLQPRRPYPQYGPTIAAKANSGHERCDIGEITVRKNSSHLTIEWNHTWAKNIGRINPMDPYHPDEFVGSFGCVRQLDRLRFVADLPFRQGRYRSIRQPALNAVVGGWTVSGPGNLYSSGQPLNLTWAGDPSGRGTNNVGLPTQSCDAKLSHQPGRNGSILHVLPHYARYFWKYTPRRGVRSVSLHV